MTEFAPPTKYDLEKLFATMGSFGDLKIPPPVFDMMSGEILAVDLPNRTLTAGFPVKEAYQNPMGFMQGGMIAAAIDNTLGPLSFMVAKPSVTKTLEIRYKRPVTPDIAKIIAQAEVVELTEQTLTIEVKVRSEKGKLLAEATAHHVIMSDKRL
jgi:uncharacterized protein (TIGR00369 family)